MVRLRSPGGCPWDRQQTHESLKPYLLEETYEVFEAIDKNDTAALKEELGDVLLQVIFHAQIAEERKEFTLEDVASYLNEKLIRRHPHVFHPERDTHVKTATDVARNWEAIKHQERQTDSTPISVLDGIPKSAPSLQRAYQVQKRASKNGFDWTDTQPVLDKLSEECKELLSAVAQLIQRQSSDSHEALQDVYTRVEDEFGDVLFSFVNMARFLKVNPEESLRKATNRFMTRFQHVEAKVSDLNRTMSQCTEKELDVFWEDAKLLEKQKMSTNKEST